jgi:hypothetical protein
MQHTLCLSDHFPSDMQITYGLVSSLQQMEVKHMFALYVVYAYVASTKNEHRPRQVESSRVESSLPL